MLTMVNTVVVEPSRWVNEEKQKKEYSISESVDKPELQLGRQITFVMPFKLIKEPTITVAITAAVSDNEVS